MQILLIILEAFLPELASKLAGPQSLTLRRRLFRSGIGILLVCVGYLLIAFAYSYLLAGGQLYTKILSDFEIASLIILSASGLALLLLARLETKQEQPTYSHFDHEPSRSEPALLQVSSAFDSSRHRSYRKIRSASWRKYPWFFSGEYLEHVWQVDVDGIHFLIRFGVQTGVRLSYDKMMEHVQPHASGFWARPKLTATLIDQTGGTRDIEIIPVGVFRPNIIVNVDGTPIPPSQPTESDRTQ